MNGIASKLKNEFEKGLSREGDDIMVKMLITYVHSLPDGTEKGDFLALDLGGSNFRVLLISTKLSSYMCYLFTCIYFVYLFIRCFFFCCCFLLLLLLFLFCFLFIYLIL